MAKMPMKIFLIANLLSIIMSKSSGNDYLHVKNQHQPIPYNMAMLPPLPFLNSLDKKMASMFAYMYDNMPKEEFVYRT